MILHFLRPERVNSREGFDIVYSSICINSEYIVRIVWNEHEILVNTTNGLISFHYIQENLDAIAKYLGDTMEQVQIIDKKLYSEYLTNNQE